MDAGLIDAWYLSDLESVGLKQARSSKKLDQSVSNVILANDFSCRLVSAFAATAAKACSGLAGLCFIDGEVPSVVLFAVEGIDGSLRFRVIGHFNKAEALAALSVAIDDDMRAENRSILCEQRVQFIILDAEAQVSNIQILCHLLSPKELGLFFYFPDHMTGKRPLWSEKTT